MRKIQCTILSALLIVCAVACSSKSATPESTIKESPSASIAATVTPSALPSTAKPSVEPTVVPTPTASPSAMPLVNNSDKPLNNFKLNVTLNANKHKLVVKQSIDYYNNTGKELKEIYFNLFPDAFKKDGGGIHMSKLSITDKSCKLKKVKETVYKVKLPSTLAVGEMMKINMDYEVNIPNIQNRFGYQEKVFNLGNFIVTPAVYDEDGWSVEPYVDLGDAFYTDIANYDVTIKVPEGYTVAASGSSDGNGNYHVANVRDFAFCASNSYEILEEETDGVKVTVYYGDGIKKTAQRVMGVAKNSLKIYGDTFGKYPYDTLSLVMNGLTGGVSGMEYPTLVMIAPSTLVENLEEWGVDTNDKDELQSNVRSIDNTTCHEIAHQWFYGIVGNDQNTEPWLDEGFASFCEYIYEKEYPPDVTDNYGYFQKNILEGEHDFIIRAQESDSDSFEDNTYFDMSLAEWMKEGSMSYSLIYGKGASLLYQMEQKMGEEAFKEAAREYVSKFAYGFVTTDSFKEFWGSKGDFKELFEIYFNKKK